MIMHDILTNHYLNTDEAYDQNILITAVDQNRDAIYHISFRDVIWTGLSDNTFAYNDQTVQNKTFTATFVYNFIDFMYIIYKLLRRINVWNTYTHSTSIW